MLLIHEYWHLSRNEQVLLKGSTIRLAAYLLAIRKSYRTSKKLQILCPVRACTLPSLWMRLSYERPSSSHLENTVVLFTICKVTQADWPTEFPLESLSTLTILVSCSRDFVQTIYAFALVISRVRELKIASQDLGKQALLKKHSALKLFLRLARSTQVLLLKLGISSLIVLSRCRSNFNSSQ